MAVAAVGGGLLIAAAGAAPAWASAPPAPHGGRTITMTAHRTAHAASRIGPHDIQPCAVKPGSAIKPASCGDQTISCVITAGGVFSFESNGTVWNTSDSTVHCSDDVTSISMQSSLLLNGNPITTTTDFTQGTDHAQTTNLAGCEAGVWNTGASAFITFPPDSSSPEDRTRSTPSARGYSNSASFCNPIGGGGGGGCALPARSLAGHPAGRHPDFVACP